MTGRIIGAYQFVEKIGSGGMGAVFRAVDLQLKREVAIKMLSADLAEQPEVLERFRAEAVTLASLNHPNIATLYGIGGDGDEAFMVMELVRGHTFGQLLARSGAITGERATALAYQVLDALEYAHRMGVVHRDIKPVNLMVNDQGLVKVMDFGISRVLGSDRCTRDGAVIGTVGYMPPEQIRGEEVDGRCDIYALGAVLYRLLTARALFDKNSGVAMMAAHLAETPDRPSIHRPDLPAWMDDVIMRALERDPADRYQTAGEFRHALETGAASLFASTPRPLRPIEITGISAPAPQPPPVVDERATNRPPTSTSTHSTPRPHASGFDIEPTITSGRRPPVDLVKETVRPPVSPSSGDASDAKRTESRAAEDRHATSRSASPVAPAAAASVTPLATPPVTPVAPAQNASPSPSPTITPGSRAAWIPYVAFFGAILLGVGLWTRMRPPPIVAPAPTVSAVEVASASPAPSAAPTSPIQPAPAPVDQPVASAPAVTPTPVDAGPAPAPRPRSSPTTGPRNGPPNTGAPASPTAPAPSATADPAAVTAEHPPAPEKPAERPPAPARPELRFSELKVLIPRGDRSREEDATLVLRSAEADILLENGSLFKKIPYASIKAATYSQSKQPVWKAGPDASRAETIFKAPLSFIRGTRHWLTLQTTDDFAVLRLDKDNYQTILPAVQTRAGIKVERVSDDK